MARKHIGFVGLGHIGSKMAMNVLKAGFPMSVYDLRQDVLQEFVKLGARAATSSKDAAKEADILIEMVFNFPQTQDVLFGPEGAIHGLRKGTIVACMNTISPTEVRQVATRLAEHGIRTLDAPVSGGVKGASEGTLTIMASGSPDVREDVREVLETMGKKIYWVGDVGSGQTLKMVNQLLYCVELVSISEALVLGMKAGGIDAQTLLDVTMSGSGDSGALRQKGEKIISGDFTSISDLDLHVKDLDLVTQAGRELGVPLMVANVAKEVLRMAQAMGKGKLDGSAVITVLEEIAGVKVRKSTA